MWLITNLTVQYIHSYRPRGRQLLDHVREPDPSELDHTRPVAQYLQDSHLRWGKRANQSLDRTLSEPYPSPGLWNTSRY